MTQYHPGVRLAGPSRLASALGHRIAYGIELTGAAELLVFVRNKLGVLFNEDFARRAEVELARMIAEILAMNTGPDQSAIGVDVHLGHSELGRRKVFLLVHAAGGWIERATRLVDAGNLVLRHTGAAMHDERKTGNFLLNRRNDVEVKRLLSLELVGAVAGADGAGQRVAPAFPHKLLDLLRVGQAGMALVDFDVLLHPAELAQLRLDTEALGVRLVDHAAGDGYVGGEVVVRGIDHDGAVE